MPALACRRRRAARRGRGISGDEWLHSPQSAVSTREVEPHLFSVQHRTPSSPHQRRALRTSSNAGFFIGKHAAGFRPDAECGGVNVRAAGPDGNAILDRDGAEGGGIEQRREQRAFERGLEIERGGEAIGEGEREAVPAERECRCKSFDVRHGVISTVRS